ncbi:MAG: hypothetical protein OXT69_08485 [Candidatus Poribacteria bacterium]|nr:hypothetical protein [Candidatus Poribacteria bacterium]
MEVSTIQDAARRALAVNERLAEHALYTGERRPTHPDSNASWRVSPDPFWISAEERAWYERLGTHLAEFYAACNLLYSHSVRGLQPEWAAELLDQGKDETVVKYGRMNRFKSRLPLVIRPDVLPTPNGYAIAELDSIPGGIGFTAFLNEIYSETHANVVGGEDGVVKAMADALRSAAKKENPTAAIAVSDESNDYRPEMEWLAPKLTEQGVQTRTVHPRELRYEDQVGVCLENERGGRTPVDILYRFFELFDLAAIPKADLLLYAARRNETPMTPPPKAYLEEKLLFALFHHPALQPFWTRELSDEALLNLQSLLPKTWVLDPSPLPPHAVVHSLVHNGLPVQDFRELGGATQKQREYVVKPSGFSPSAWGSRGVVVGHDLSAEDWRAALEHALSQFSTTPHILQPYHKGSRFQVPYYDFEAKEIRTMDGRARLTPYYFMADGKARLGGIQATVCPSNKKKLHGMVDAAIAPCAVRE